MTAVVQRSGEDAPRCKAPLRALEINVTDQKHKNKNKGWGFYRNIDDLCCVPCFSIDASSEECVAHATRFVCAPIFSWLSLLSIRIRIRLDVVEDSRTESSGMLYEQNVS